MPTRLIDVRVLRKAFDELAPAAASPKQYLRWKQLAQLVGLGEHWIRKRYQDRDRSELEIKSIARIRKALERRYQQAPGEELKELIQTLTHAENYGAVHRPEARPRHGLGERLRLRVINVGFIRSSNANYCQRLEGGIRFGMLDGLETTHLLNDESVDLGSAASPAARLALVQELLARFNRDPGYVDRTYIVPLGTVAAMTLARALRQDGRLRSRLGKDLRVIFAGVTDPPSTGIMEFSHDYIGGMYAGGTFADRLQFIAEAFPDRKIVFMFDPNLPQDVIAQQQIAQLSGVNVELLSVPASRSTRLPPAMARDLVTGYTVINHRIHEFVRDNPRTPFVGANISDLARGALLSTGNDDLRFGIDCARRLLVPDCRNEINLRDLQILRPEPVYGINQKACNLHGLVPTMAARNRCKVVVE